MKYGTQSCKGTPRIAESIYELVFSAMHCGSLRLCDHKYRTA